ncbi:MAG: sulfatase-like hydrolase/transferase, partial [Gemmatimonadota bacterium]|nr:sulfatase-like hydrolase/transferase [Gemmatimonadota bacterium]
MRSSTTREPEVGRLGLTARILTIALWAGLVTGLIEALRLWVDQAVRGRVIFTSDYGLWMTPLLYALVFAALGLGLAGLTALFYPRIRERVAVFLFVALAVLCLFIPITQIARWAAALIALGVGAQAARFTSSHRERSRRIARVALGTLTGLALVLYAGGRASRGGPASGELARPDLPNILLIVWDTVRSENLSLYGYEQPTTPVLEDLAARAAVFDRAVAPSPWT